MNKLLLTLLLALVSTSAMAEWTLVDWGDDKNTFIDLNTMHRDGNKVKVWTLLNFKAVQGKGKDKYHSLKTQHQYDCKEVQFKILASITYSGGMGEGKNSDMFNTPNDEWAPIIPDSLVDETYQIACGKK